MAVLAVGRVGLHDVDLDRVEGLKQANDSSQGRAVRISGHLRASTLAETNYLRDSLLTIEPGTLVPITYTKDPEINGFYFFRWASVEMNADTVGLNAPGWMAFEVVADRLGNHNDIWFQSRVTGTVRTNIKGVVESETEPTVTPPGSYTNWWADQGTAIHKYTQRRSTGGDNMIVFRDKDLYDLGINPRWSVTSTQWYENAVKLTVGGYVRPGRTIPNNTTDWEISNSLIRVKPWIPAGTTDDGFLFSVYSSSAGAWLSDRQLQISYFENAFVSEYDTVTCLRNDPEMVVLRFIGSWNVDRKTQIHDLSMRRGDRFVTWRTNRSGESNVMRFRHNPSTAGWAEWTPTGFTDAAGMVSPTIAGMKYVMMTNSTIASNAQPYLQSTDSNTASFAYGVEYQGASATTGNEKDSLAYQYMGAINEQVRPVVR